MTPCIVLTTVGAGFDARPLAQSLLEARLAACVNIVPGLTSVYRWQGAVETDSEQLLVIKTTVERSSELRDALLRQHPYQVPEFLVLPIQSVEGPYRAWLIDSVSDAR